MAIKLLSAIAFMSSPDRFTQRKGASRIFRIAVEQFDGNALGSTQEADLDAGPRRMWLLRELDALLLEIGRDRIDARNRKAEMVETLIRRNWCRVDAVAGINLCQKDHGAPKL